MKFSVCLTWLIFSAALSSAQTPAAPAIRTWTSLDGRKLDAVFLAVKGDGVEVKMASGSTFTVPLARLSAGDQQYVKSVAVGAAAPKAAAATEWPRNVALPDKPEIVVVKEDAAAKQFVYRSPHYEFQCDSKLGANVVREFGRMFEATYLINSLLPLNLKPAPEPLREFFLARLFTQKADYMSEGGIEGSAGVYMSGKKALMVPLTSLGVKMVGNRVALENGSDDDNATLIHEITHQMMNHWLRHLPTWFIEGSAEYVEMLEYNSNGRFSLMGMDRQLKKYVNRMHYEGDGKRYPMLDLEELMNLDGGRWAAALGKGGNAHQNYGSAGLLTYYFYHLDGAGDAANVISFFRAVENAKTNEEEAAILKQHLMRERTYAQLAEDVKKAFRKEGVDITFDAPGKNPPASAAKE